MLYPRMTWEFQNQVSGYGWSESLYATGSYDNLDPVREIAKNYALKRVKMLARSVVMTYIRVSFDDILRDSQVINGPTPNIDPLTKRALYNLDYNEQPAPDDSCLNVRLECGDLYRGPIYLSGMASGELTNFINDRQFFGVFLAAYLDWKNFLKKTANQIGLKVLPKRAEGDAFTKITAITFAAGNIIITSPAHGLVSGDNVRVNKVKVKSGRFSLSNLPVIKIDVDNVAITTYPRPLPGAYIGGGEIQKLVPLVKAITDVISSSVTHRKRGRVFGQRRGRV